MKEVLDEKFRIILQIGREYWNNYILKYFIYLLEKCPLAQKKLTIMLIIALIIP